MARYSLNLPADLKRQAEEHAIRQGVSLNQFLMWAVAEKVGALAQNLDDPEFPLVTYRRGGSGLPEPVLRGTSIRVKTMVVAAHRWQLAPEEIAAEYGLSEAQVRAALSFYAAHRPEIDALLGEEKAMEDAAFPTTPD